MITVFYPINFLHIHMTYLPSDLYQYLALTLPHALVVGLAATDRTPKKITCLRKGEVLTISRLEVYT